MAARRRLHCVAMPWSAPLACSVACTTHSRQTEERSANVWQMEDFTHLQQRTDAAVSSPCPEHRLALPCTRRQPPREAHDRRTQRQRRLRSARIALPPLPCCRLERPNKHLRPTDANKHITSQRRVVQTAGRQGTSARGWRLAPVDFGGCSNTSLPSSPSSFCSIHHALIRRDSQYAIGSVRN